MKKFTIILAAAVALASCKKTGQTVAPAEAGKDLIKTEADFAKEAQNKPLTAIALDAPSFDFGKIKQGDNVSHTYEITNTGDKPLVISAVHPGCGCTASEYTKEPVLPGKKATVTLNFDSSNFAGIVNKFAKVFMNTEKTPVTLTFTAEIQK